MGRKGDDEDSASDSQQISDSFIEREVRWSGPELPFASFCPVDDGGDGQSLPLSVHPLIDSPVPRLCASSWIGSHSGTTFRSLPLILLHDRKVTIYDRIRNHGTNNACLM